MLTRGTRFKILVFVVLSLVTVGYVGVRYAGLGRFFGGQGATVHLELADSGGIYPDADVTYRGVTVGKVGAVRLGAQGGTEADLVLDRDAPPVPADVEAVVANRSAVGEQYVDLLPRTGSGPFLGDGSVIASGDTQTPVPTEQLLDHVEALAGSVPTGQLRTVVDELDNALSGSAAPDLRQLLDSTDTFTSAALDHLDDTRQLLSSARVVLDTQNAQSGQIKDFSANLRVLAAQLKSSDGDLRHLITAAPQAAQQIDAVLTETGPQLGVLLANVLTTADVIAPRRDGIEDILVSYPQLMTLANTVVPGDGTAHLGLVLNFFDPYVCTRGYENTVRRPADQVSPAPANTTAYCALPQGSPTSVRGSQNAPYGGKPVAVPPPAAVSSSGSPAGGAPLPGLLGAPALSGPTSLAGLLGLSGAK
ncbi:MlaD family protein [Amycolatopsis sp. NPDC049253]|uniref:MlaD family protein n=1 Tax=Amycolatopsis sp. NPDC049253 TaxID=3155274 RepID=UPI00341667FF